MSAISKIQWTDRTWNPVRGCALVSEGCRNCYAMKQAHRFSGPGKAYQGLTERGPNGPRWTGEARSISEALAEPLHWKRPARIFVNSMSDLFHEDVDDGFIDKVFAVMALTPQHTYQILTKRPERMREYADAPGRLLEIAEAGTIVAFDAISKWGFSDVPGMAWDRGAGAKWKELPRWPLPNVWLGVSVENQSALERIDILKDVPAAVRFVSFEPLLEDLGALILDRIHWAIVGGESGPGARPFNIHWARQIIRECREQLVACFVKQLGARPFLHAQRSIHEERPGFLMTLQQLEFKSSIQLEDTKGGDPSEWPADLQVREFPREVLL
jgi:protein gp37